MSDTLVAIELEITALGVAPFRVSRFEGEHRISGLYQMEIEFVAETATIDFEATLGRHAALHVRHGAETQSFFGVVAEIELERELAYGTYLYRVRVMPRIHVLELNLQSEIYGTVNPVSVADILLGELTGIGQTGQKAETTPHLATEDVELRLTRDYRKRDYVVQYNESDLNFISRLMEHDGIFYYFQHRDGREIMVVGDDNSCFADLPGSAVAYRPPSGAATAFGEAVQRFAARGRRVPSRVVLRDYNYQTPGVQLQSETDVVGRGKGVLNTYGENFTTLDEGQRLARVRAEAQRGRQLEFVGESDIPQLMAGYRVEIYGHFRDDYNQRYILTRVRHFGSQDLPELSSATAGAAGASYRNEFTCIPASVAYRPEQRAQRPHIGGLMNATVDAEGSGARAEIDGQGRYKVVLPYDQPNNPAARASAFVRMAQPYAGAGRGMHFPLLKGTEAVISHEYGDPDRPIIVGAVPNPTNTAVSVATSHDKNRIRTTSGVLMEFADGAEDSGSYARLHVPRATMPSYIRLGSVGEQEETTLTAATLGGPTDGLAEYTAGDHSSKAAGTRHEETTGSKHEAVGGGRTETVVASHVETVGIDKTVTVAANSSESVGADKTLSVTANLSETVGADTAVSIAVNLVETVGADKTVSIDGDHHEATGGDHNETIEGSERTTIRGDMTELIDGDVTETVGGDETRSIGGSETVTVSGNETRTVRGNATETVLGGETRMVYATSVEIFMGAACDIKLGVAIDMVGGLAIDVKPIELKLHEASVRSSQVDVALQKLAVTQNSIDTRMSAIQMALDDMVFSQQTLRILQTELDMVE